MEFSFNCQDLLNADLNGFTMLNSQQIHKKQDSNFHKIFKLIDVFCGHSAGRRQGQDIITSAISFMNSDNDKIILKVQENKVFGFLRFGPRSFIIDSHGKKPIFKAFFVIDFYVYHSKQKEGIGKSLYDYMLRFLKTAPEDVGVFSANNPMRNFLRKKYKIENLISISDSLSISSNHVRKLKGDENNLSKGIGADSSYQDDKQSDFKGNELTKNNIKINFNNERKIAEKNIKLGNNNRIGYKLEPNRYSSLNNESNLVYQNNLKNYLSLSRLMNSNDMSSPSKKNSLIINYDRNYNNNIGTNSKIIMSNKKSDDSNSDKSNPFLAKDVLLESKNYVNAQSNKKSNGIYRHDSFDYVKNMNHVIPPNQDYGMSKQHNLGHQDMNYILSDPSSPLKLDRVHNRGSNFPNNNFRFIAENIISKSPVKSENKMLLNNVNGHQMQNHNLGLNKIFLQKQSYENAFQPVNRGFDKQFNYNNFGNANIFHTEG